MSSAHRSRHARWSTGRYGRIVTGSASWAAIRDAASVIRSYLLSLPPMRSRYGVPRGSGIPAVTPASPARVPDPPADPRDARRGRQHLGGALARLHKAGADRFGTDWPAYIGSLPLPEERGDGWPEWFASARIAPYLRTSADRGALNPADVAAVERLLENIGDHAGPTEP